jgi:hypothetical protein
VLAWKEPYSESLPARPSKAPFTQCPNPLENCMQLCRGWLPWLRSSHDLGPAAGLAARLAGGFVLHFSMARSAPVGCHIGGVGFVRAFFSVASRCWWGALGSFARFFARPSRCLVGPLASFARFLGWPGHPCPGLSVRGGSCMVWPLYVCIAGQSIDAFGSPPEPSDGAQRAPYKRSGKPFVGPTAGLPARSGPK